MSLLGTLALTHSSRTTDLSRCSADFLRQRFGRSGRLDDLPPYPTLPPVKPLYRGAVSFHRLFEDGAGRVRVERLGSVKRRDKLQHVAFASATELWAGYEHRLERWRLAAPLDELQRLDAAACTVEVRFEHPHLVAAHTVEPLAVARSDVARSDVARTHAARAAVSCSAADAVLVVDLASGDLERTLRLPEELYGRGYPLVPEHDLRRHSVGDDRQTTHVNAAFASADGRRLAVSTLIQGAIGVFDLESGAYRELARGFVGCHGARFNDRGEIYFANSPRGELVFLDDAGAVVRRFAVPTRWLHDVQHVGTSLYAFALNAPNELRIYDVDRGVLCYRERFFAWPVERFFAVARRLPWWLGNSTQALSFQPSGRSRTADWTPPLLSG